MAHNQLSTIEKQLQQIAEMLLLNGTITECPGLIHGKMGVAVFFFHYTQYTDNTLFADYAIDLIGEMQQQIHANSPADYEKGIAGIGVGIDYLIRHKLLVATDDICDDLDHRMYRAVMYDPWQDLSLYDGLTGYGRYWISRLHHQTPSAQAKECLLYIIEQIEKKWPNITEKEQNDVYCFLHDLHQISGFNVETRLIASLRERELQSTDINTRFPRLGNTFVGNIARTVQHDRYFNDILHDEIDLTLPQTPDPDMEKPFASMGLLTGYAGEGMWRLTALNKTNTLWINLL